MIKDTQPSTFDKIRQEDAEWADWVESNFPGRPTSSFTKDELHSLAIAGRGLITIAELAERVNGYVSQKMGA